MNQSSSLGLDTPSSHFILAVNIMFYFIFKAKDRDKKTSKPHCWFIVGPIEIQPKMWRGKQQEKAWEQKKF